MRIISWLLFSLTLSACGSNSSSDVTGTSTAPIAVTVPTPAESAILQSDTMLTPDDIGAIVLGDSITIPAFQERQLAAVVSRSGKFSPTDSFVETTVCSDVQKKSIRLVAFTSNGPLRPGTTDTLVMLLGRSQRFSGSSAPLSGNSSPPILRSGQPYAELFDLTYGDHVIGHSYSNDVHHQENTIYSVHVYARLVALAANDPRQSELHHSGRGTTIAGELPITRLEEIVPPERMVTAAATTTF